jgi:hypothetical protein
MEAIMKPGIIRLALLLLTLTLSGEALALERVPGTQIALDPPVGFEPSTRFSGYQHGTSDLSLIVSELPLPYSKALDGFSAKGLARHGMTLLDQHEVRLGDQPAMLYHVSQGASGVLFYKWLLLFGNEQVTEMVVAVFPEQAETQWSAPLKQVLLNTRWQRDVKPDVFEGLGYHVQESGDLKIATKISTTLLLTRNGIPPKEPNDDPYFAITPSFAQDWQMPQDTLAYTRNRLQQLENLCDEPQISHEEAVSVDRLKGYQLQATCKDKRSGAPLAILHTMVFSDEGYYLFLAVARDTDKAAYAPIFKKIIHSFKRG